MKQIIGKWIVVGTGVGTVFIGGGALLHTSRGSAEADQEASAGAKLTKMPEQPFALPKETGTSDSERQATEKIEESGQTEKEAVKEKVKEEVKETAEGAAEQCKVAAGDTPAVRSIVIAHGERVTKEDLMNHQWIPVVPYLDELLEDLDGDIAAVTYSSLVTFTETERHVVTINMGTGEVEQGTEGTPSAYTLVGEQFDEVMQLTNQTLQGTYLLSWQGSNILFNPYDVYDHKQDRQLVLQPVEIVK